MIQETSSLSINTAEISKHIEHLFLRFAAFYGHVWRSNFKSAEFLTFVKKEWNEGLKKFSEKVVEEATNSCRDSAKHCDYPPTLPQFITMCKPIAVAHANEQLRLQQQEKDKSFVRIAYEVVAADIKKLTTMLCEKMDHRGHLEQEKNKIKEA